MKRSKRLLLGIVTAVSICAIGATFALTACGKKDDGPQLVADDETVIVIGENTGLSAGKTCQFIPRYTGNYTFSFSDYTEGTTFEVYDGLGTMIAMDENNAAKHEVSSTNQSVFIKSIGTGTYTLTVDHKAFDDGGMIVATESLYFTDSYSSADSTTEPVHIQVDGNTTYQFYGIPGTFTFGWTGGGTFEVYDSEGFVVPDGDSVTLSMAHPYCYWKVTGPGGGYNVAVNYTAPGDEPTVPEEMAIPEGMQKDYTFTIDDTTYTLTVGATASACSLKTGGEAVENVEFDARGDVAFEMLAITMNAGSENNGSKSYFVSYDDGTVTMQDEGSNNITITAVSAE